MLQENPKLKAPAYGLTSGLLTVVFWALMPLLPFDGNALVSLVVVVLLIAGVVAMVKMLQWLSEVIFEVPFQMRHILTGLFCGYLLSLLLLVLVGFLPVFAANLAGFSLGNGLMLGYFAKP